MVKQLIVSVLEDVVGEYILNISKDNLKIAALRGKVKLENVQLDGELIGSHVLGAMGLSEFGVLSCWARSLKMVVPLKNLEKEPTRFEIHGLHLLCVPLVPSTANKLYGAGTPVDPRCSLRTRAKRSALARFERNYFAGRIPGEGPPSRRVQRAVKVAGREMRKRKSKLKKQGFDSETLETDGTTGDDEGSDWNDASFYSDSFHSDPDEHARLEKLPAAFRIPIVQQNWTTRMREKMLGNIEASIYDIHVRCEVSENGLEANANDDADASWASTNGKSRRSSVEERAFSFGLTCKSCIVRSANEDWDIGVTKPSSGEDGEASSDGSGRQESGSGLDQRGRLHRIGELTDVSIYWDDNPPLLISETPVVVSRDHRLPANKLQSKISSAMEALALNQDPGDAVRRSLSASEAISPVRNSTNGQDAAPVTHHYFLKSFNLKMHGTLGDRDQPGPMTLLAEVLPVDLEMTLASHQYLQYRKLRGAILSQKRFDTMVHQRPTVTPLQNPAAWWKYAIDCVTTRPTSRPWSDVTRIARSRTRYIYLVKTKILRSSEGRGFHGGLAEKASLELLALEDLLPIEALMAFHLLACRAAHEDQRWADSKVDRSSHRKSDVSLGATAIPPPRARRKSSFKRIRGALSGSLGSSREKSASIRSETELVQPDMLESMTLEGEDVRDDMTTEASLIEAIRKRLGRKKWFNTFQMDDIKIAVLLIDPNDEVPFLRLEARASGRVRTFGIGKRKLMFNIMQFDVVDLRSLLLPSAPTFFSDGKILRVEESRLRQDSLPESHDGRRFMGNLPDGVVCRFLSSQDYRAFTLGISALPATLVWNKGSIDSLSDFFDWSATNLNTKLTRQLQNVATPVARRAQKALHTPNIVRIDVDVAAPKVWVPVSPESSDGALYLDAGRLNISCHKKETETDLKWVCVARNIQVDFVRATGHPSTRGEEELRVVRPFHVCVDSSSTTEEDIGTGRFDIFPSSRIVDKEHGVFSTIVEISPICLNLVDAEILARAIGQWYATGLFQVKRRAASAATNGTLRKSSTLSESTERSRHASQQRAPEVFSGGTTHLIAIAVEKFELALEGHSKRHAQAASLDDQSVCSYLSQETLGSTPRKRTYIFEIVDVRLERATHLYKTQTNLGITDVSIVQVKESPFRSTSRSPFRSDMDRFSILSRALSGTLPNSSMMTSTPASLNRRDPLERFSDISAIAASPSQVEVSTDTNGTAILSSTPTITPILSAKFLHDGEQHVDEMEIDVESLVVGITPVSLKDCTKAMRRVLELLQLMTREMERKVHEQGRKARQKGFGLEAPDGERFRSSSPTSSVLGTELSAHLQESLLPESSLLFRITLEDITILAGRQLLPGKQNQHESGILKVRAFSNEILQLRSKTLIMFQSVENPDATGRKTLHVSLDNFSTSFNHKFERVDPSEVPPMIGPSSAEFRIAYATESQGCVVSQDVSFDCEATRAYFTPFDVSILTDICRSMFERLQPIVVRSESDDRSQKVVEEEQVSQQQHRLSVIRYQTKGTGIATNIQVEIQELSFVLLCPREKTSGTRPFLNLVLKSCKGNLAGCLSALSGELTAIGVSNFFNIEVGDWEYAVEPLRVSLAVDQMPNELILKFVTVDALQINLTSCFLKDIATMDLSWYRLYGDNDESALDPYISKTAEDYQRDASTNYNTTSTPSDSCSITLLNLSGVDVNILPMDSEAIPDLQGAFIEAGDKWRMDHVPGLALSQKLSEQSFKEIPRFSLGLAPSSAGELGDRERILGLPATSSSGQWTSLHRLEPAGIPSPEDPLRLQRRLSGRSTPETSFSDITSVGGSNLAYYNAEPVVEWCMENQRLRSSVGDVFGLEKGKDVLSSQVWSPEDQSKAELELLESPGREPLPGDDNWDLAKPTEVENVPSPRRKAHAVATTHFRQSNWVRPYLKDDSPEWTDMTAILRMARERVMLPDSNWIWLNNWTVDLSGSYGESTDSDGWEYEADFETFTRSRRYYARGDSCRRRRWTRTRIVRPPEYADPFRQLSIVWETKREKDRLTIVVRSPLTLHNRTASPLAFFLYTPSWDSDRFVGVGEVDEQVQVPVPLASAAYLRFGVGTQDQSRQRQLIDDYAVTRRVMILPTGYTSSGVLRTAIKKENFRAEMSPTEHALGDMHFLVHVKCVKGVTDIFVEPVLRIVNLLPCQLQCEVGEVSARAKLETARATIGRRGKTVHVKETLTISTGDEGRCTTISPALKPHLSLRVPGYQWSPWQRVVNRKANSYTWQPPDVEDDFYTHSHQGDGDYAEELKSSVRFERIGNAGDPLVLIMSVEAGHCPTLRVYAQYWILDKTGFGCRFCDSFIDLLSAIPDGDTSRRSHLLAEEAKDPELKSEMIFPGHQWTIGMNGMSLYFSKREKIALSIETGGGAKNQQIRSRWVAPLDISNVIPKTVVTVDESGGPRRFDLAISVTVCPASFARTKLITLCPRYEIVNLLQRKLVVAQNGCLQTSVTVPPQSSVPFHCEKRTLPPKVRLGAPSAIDFETRDLSNCWTNGCIQLDKIGITSMRIPTPGNRFEDSKPMIVQAEVRLAAKDQSSAVVIVIWATDENSNPLYIVRNRTSKTILCRQPLHREMYDVVHPKAETAVDYCTVGEMPSTNRISDFDFGMELCGTLLGADKVDEFVWTLKENDVACFGFDDPEKPHVLEWTVVGYRTSNFDKLRRKAFLEIDTMGSQSSIRSLDGNEIGCRIVAEHSTKVIEFSEGLAVNGRLPQPGSHGLGEMKSRSIHFQEMLDDKPQAVERNGKVDDEEVLAISVRLELPDVSVSIIDNATPMVSGREILAGHLEKLSFEFSQNRERYHEFELRLMSLQVDNHVHRSIHPVLLNCPRIDDREPLVHMSAVRRLQPHSTTFVFRYCAVRILEIHLFLDRRTAETIARFVRPLLTERAVVQEDPNLWIQRVTSSMARQFAKPDRRAPRDIEQMIQTGNSGRIYFEQLHLHPVRLALTFTQEWMEWNPGAESLMIFQFIRGMASIANAPLTFNSFVVAHVFESPHALQRIVVTHYSSQLTKQIFGILGSLAILGAPADFISNVGTGVRDFFYEPINGLVHGPAQFIEGLEAGTQSLARGVFVGVVRGAANVTEVVNSNLAELTADDNFIDERKAHHRMLMDAMSRGVTSRSIRDSLYLAGGSIARGVKSGALGIMEQPSMYASKHGPVGFVKGVGKAVVGAFLKPVVGIGDAAVLVMNHVSDSTSDKKVIPKIPKRLRRALPRLSSEKPQCVQLSPYDDRAAKAQKIVTGGESVDDVYIGHVNIPSHLIIASEHCLWAIDRRSREPWCVSWGEISHFGMMNVNTLRITVFSQSGLKSFAFRVDDAVELSELHHLLSMQLAKMGNAASSVGALTTSLFNGGLENLSSYDIPGIKVRQQNYVFGSCNNTRKWLTSTAKDEIDVIEQSFGRVKEMGSESPILFKKLDDEAWNLVVSWGQVFSGLSSRRCIVAGIINGTGNAIQVKSTKLVEGGSPCYSIPTKEYDSDQGVLHPGGAIIFFAWGVVPNLLQAGNVFMNIETNAFVCELSDQKGRFTVAEALSGYQVGFLEKSYDESGWWAKYWLLVRRV